MAPSNNARPCASDSHRKSSACRIPTRRSKTRRGQAALIVAILIAARSAAAADLGPPPLLVRPIDERPTANAPAAVPPQERRPLMPQAKHATSGADAPTAVSGTTASSGGPTGAGASIKTASDSGSSARSDGNANPKVGASQGMAATLWEKLEIVPIVVLVGVLGAAALLMRMLAGRTIRGAGRPEGVIEVLARYPIGRGQQIVLMRVGRRVIVAHQADRSMRTLMETSDADEVAELIAKARSSGGDLFSRMLDRSQRTADPFADAEMVDLTRDTHAVAERHGSRAAVVRGTRR